VVTECAGASTLVFKTTYHPNWRVFIDGREATRFMVSPSMIGMDVPPGTHVVRAEYHSAISRTVLLIVGLLTLAGLLAARPFVPALR
jgi:hypothetical protein